MSGRQLFEILIANTGLPEEFVRARFETLLEQKGLSPETIGLDEVREILADYLLDLINEGENEKAPVDVATEASNRR